MTGLHCAICNVPNAEPCTTCHSTGWCTGSDCKDRDFLTHNLLCGSISALEERPPRLPGYDDYALAVFFPVNETQPRLVWVVIGQGGIHGRIIGGTETERLIVNMKGEHLEERTFSIRNNIRRGFNLSTRGRVQIRCAASSEYSKLPSNKSLFKFGSHSALRQLRGPAVVVRSTLDDADKKGTLEDITLRDFRSALDYCWAFNPKQVPELRRDEIVELTAQAVRIQSRDEISEDPENKHAFKQYIPEIVQPRLWVNKKRLEMLHPVFNAPLSPLSQLIDFPLYVRRIKHVNDCSCTMRAWTENAYASFLMIDYDVMSMCFGQPLAQFGLQDHVGGVLVARIDRLKLYIGQVEAISYYSRNTLDEIRRYLIEEPKSVFGSVSDSFNAKDEKEKGDYQQEINGQVLKYATPEHFDAFFELYRAAASRFDSLWETMLNPYHYHRLNKRSASDIAARRARCEAEIRSMFEKMGSEWKTGPTQASTNGRDSTDPSSSAMSSPMMVPQRR